MTKRGLLLWVLAAMLSISAMPSWAAPAGKPTGPKAGNITALLPVAHIVRGSGKQAVTTDAKKGDDLVWNDLIKTEKGGRARVTLADQSILSLGSQAELRIVKHDARSQQTTLQMAYGRVRAQVANITRDGGSFELRTPTAVAGVIGTDFGVDSSSVGGDTFVCLAGAVQVANSDKTVAGSVQCTAGQTTTVSPGKPPTAPKPASQQQLQQMLQDTDTSIAASINPAGGLPGATIDSNVVGQKLAGVNAVNVSGSGVTVTLKSQSNDSVQVHIVVAQNAAPGPRMITLSKQTGSPSSAIFTVLGAPNGDSKTAYLQTLQELTQTGITGLGGFLTGAQQTADQVSTQVTNANLNLPKPIDLSPFANQLNQQYGGVQTSLQGQNGAILTAEQNAVNEFGSAYDLAYQALLQRDSTGTPDATFRTAINNAFTAANNSVLAAINGAQTLLNGNLQEYGNNLNQLQESWIQNINQAFQQEQPGPTIKVNALERIVELGATASFDASGSSAGQGGNIMSTTWTLCSQSYQPSGFGNPLDPGVQPCNGISGYASSQTQFDVPTCSLQAGSYFIRLAVTDSNNKVTPMDLKLTVVAPNYGTPTQAVRALADAYGSLQLSQFLRAFDSNSFPGYTQLSENMRQTLQALNSMNINLRSSQDSVTCNDATTRADWQQNYTFRNSPNEVFSQEEQLSVRMRRVPGTGWLITDFQGDNGTVQGVPPGPQISDQALPDLVVTSSTIGQSQLDIMSPSPVAPGLHTVKATVSNTGNADLIANMPLTISLLDANSTVVASSTQNVPLPVSQGSTGVVSADLMFPQGKDGTKLTLMVNINSGCQVQEKNCDGKNQQSYPLTIQNNAITFANVTPNLNLLPGGQAGTVSMGITSTYYPAQVCASGLNLITANPACQTLNEAETVTFAMTADLTAPIGLQNAIFKATNNGDPTTGVPPVSVTTQVPITVVVAKYVITSVVFAGHNAPLTGKDALQIGESTQVIVTVQNQGNASPTGTLTISATCNDPEQCNPITATGPAPAAGASVVISGNLPSVSLPVASYIGTASVTSDITGAQYGANFTLPFDVVDFTISANAITPSQNLPIGLTGVVSLAVAVQVPTGNPFGIPITPVPTATVTYTPTTQTTNGSNIPFTVNVGQGTPPSTNTPDLITVNATNHGVTKSATIPVNYYNALMVPLNLFVNDSGNPLEIPVAVGANPPTHIPDVSLKMTGNYIGGTAALTVVNPNCGGFSDTPSPTTVDPNDQIDFPIYASTGNTCPAASQVLIQAAIPNTNPPTTQTVYTLFVTPSGLPQLQVVSVTPPRDLSSTPWLAGEPLDWTVVVKNVGSGSSTGNEPVVLSLNNGEVGRGSIGSAIAPNAQAQVTVHTVGPDVAADANFGPTASLLAHIVLDTKGDLDPGTGDLTSTVSVSNWSLVINGNGQSDGQPVSLNTVGPTTGTSNITLVSQHGSFNPNLTLPVVIGTYSQNQLIPPSPSPGSVSASAGSTVTVGLQNGLTPLSGYYFSQVIAQMKDGGNVTTQRQATIHINLINDSGKSPGFVVLASDRNNIGDCSDGCQTPPNTVQINGPLPEAFTLTASLSFCSTGPCTGPIDVSFTDSYMTTTSPLTSTMQVTSPGNTLPIRVKAADNPDGSINTGSATVMASVTAIQASPYVRNPGPDPVGNNQYQMTFNIGDLQLSASNFCSGVRPQDPTAISLGLSWVPISGFNVPTLSWEWEDGNHIPVSGNPLNFSVSSGTSTYSSGNYSALPTFNLTNPSTGVDGLQTYYLAVTVTNNLSTATEYFPFQFDLSQSQTFCPNTGNGNFVRGNGRAIGGHVIRGTWGKSGLNAPTTRLAPKLVPGKLADLRINAADISFTPSMPKNGDVVNVRFRISNIGDADATSVPVALQVNGALVVTDTFDIGAGKTTLGALQWSNAKAPPAAATPGTLSRAGRVSRDAGPTAAGLSSLQAAVVIDPHQTLKQKSTLGKSAALAHFSIHDGAATSNLTATLSQQRVVLELGEGGCGGLRFDAGAGGCSRADVAVNVEDLAKGTYKLEASNGIADLGVGNKQYSNANFGPNALGQNGHTYAVQLGGGRVGLFTMTAVRNPDQLSEAAKRVFNKPGVRAIRTLGNSTGAPQPDSAKDAKVYFDISYQGQ